MSMGFWLAGAICAACLYPTRHARNAGPRTFAARVLGLAIGAAAAHLGWVAAHAAAIVEATGLVGLVRAVLDPGAGASILFVPVGPVIVRGLLRDELAALDADVRALVPGLALARLGCVFAGCCGGDAQRLPWATIAGAGGEVAAPVAALSFAGLLLVGWWARHPGAGPAALAGVAVLRAALEPLRAPPAHGGATDWIVPCAGVWVCAALVWRGWGPGRQRGPPSCA